MKMDDIRELIQLMEESTLEELEFEQEGVRLSLKKPLSSPVPQDSAAVTPVPFETANNERTEMLEHPQADEADDDDRLHKVVSPMVGTFYQAPAPDAAPFVQAGDRVTPETVVCIVEAMKLMNEIEAEVEGEIVKLLVENGQLVEYGQPLFLVQT